MNRMFFRGLLIVLLVSIGISALLGIGAVLSDIIFNDTAAKVLVTAITIGSASIACLAATVPLSRGRRKPLAASAMIASAWAALLIILTVWFLDSLRSLLDPIPHYVIDEYFIKSLSTFSLIAGFLAVSSVLTMPRMKAIAATCVQYATQAVMTLLLVYALAAMWSDANDDLTFQGMSVLMILTAVGLIGTPMLALFLGTKTKAELTEVATALRLTCPRCLTAQDMPVGDGRCSVCKLKFKIEVEEPRCPKCNYILRGLTRPVCPECGLALHPNELAAPATPALQEVHVPVTPPPQSPASETPPA